LNDENRKGRLSMNETLIIGIFILIGIGLIALHWWFTDIDGGNE
jgi:hypothetical protein